VTKRAVVSWSTGKDSAWCLHELRRTGGVEIVGLLTTVTPEFDRVSIHGTRREILTAQAEGLGLPVWEVELPYPCPNEAYEAAMRDATTGLSGSWDVTHVGFGDLFLEDVRAYREEAMEETPLSPIFPLWGRDTGELARQMVEGGVEAVIVSAPDSSDAVDLVGRPWDPDALAALAPSVDPCGERGEFHTCVVAAPGLEGIEHHLGEVVDRDGARYVDLLPGAR
jgi:uncharacterized protein (TIGR00290 family)